MSVSTPYTETTPGSVSRMNRTTVITDTGANLSVLDKTKHKIVACSSTGSGYTLDHAYLFTEDGTTAIDLRTLAAHTHTSSADGGDIGSLYSAEPNVYYTDLLMSKTDDLKKAQWIEAITSTGVITDDTDGTTFERSIKLDSGATSGASAQISYPHISADLARNLIFECKLRFGTATSLAFHSGVGADDITAADSNTRKVQVELCTTTNNNFFLRTANGSANSASDTGIAFSTTRVYLRVNHYPTLGTPETDLLVDNGTLLQKTTNIPVSGSTAHVNLLKHSMKNSTAASRTMFCYPTRLRYYMTDLWA